MRRALLKVGLAVAAVAMAAGLVVAFSPGRLPVHRVFFLVPPVLHDIGGKPVVLVRPLTSGS